MKITYMTTLGVNVGDEFIRAGIRAILEAANIKHSALYVCKHDLTTLFRSVEDETLHVPDKFWDTDVFIQAGAPVFWRNKDGSSSLTSPWFKYLWEERILTGKKKFLNLGAGSCQSIGESHKTYLNDGACTNYAHQTLKVAALTTVRDPVAFSIAQTIGGNALALPCPAFYAAQGWRQVPKQEDLIGVNLMPLACHHDLNNNFDAVAWYKKAFDITKALRRQGRLVFIAHDITEAGFMQRFAAPGERVFMARGWRDYLDVYGACSKVVANRVHGAVLAAGFGAKACIIGNDTRIQIGQFVGIPFLRADTCDVALVLKELESVHLNALKTHQFKSFNEYVFQVSKAIQS
jgi:polysaccharide pyruvyl transferase WcaK-like protein